MNATAFWNRIDRSGGPSACWPWMRARTGRGGYGHFSESARMVRAHRAAYELAHGPIPARLLVLHSCDNPPCCNPGHLFLGTDADNRRDAVRKGRAYSKLTPNEWAAIRSRRAAGEGVRALAREYGVDHSRVSRISRDDRTPPVVAA